MKNILIIIFCLPTFLLAQAPQGFTYQGVATNNEGVELSNHEIAIKASVIAEAANGILVYEETHLVITDAFGLFNVVIGLGQSENDFSLIDWGDTNHFLKIELDINGGNEFIHIGTQQMMSVPYALYAENTRLDSVVVSNMIGNAIDTLITNLENNDSQSGGSLNDFNNVIENSDFNTNVLTEIPQSLDNKEIILFSTKKSIYITDSVGSFTHKIYSVYDDFIYSLTSNDTGDTLYFLQAASEYIPVSIMMFTTNNLNVTTIGSIPVNGNEIRSFEYKDGAFFYIRNYTLLKYQNGSIEELQSNSIYAMTPVSNLSYIYSYFGSGNTFGVQGYGLGYLLSFNISGQTNDLYFDDSSNLWVYGDYNGAKISKYDGSSVELIYNSGDIFPTSQCNGCSNLKTFGSKVYFNMNKSLFSMSEDGNNVVIITSSNDEKEINGIVPLTFIYDENTNSVNENQPNVDEFINSSNTKVLFSTKKSIYVTDSIGSFTHKIYSVNDDFIYSLTSNNTGDTLYFLQAASEYTPVSIMMFTTNNLNVTTIGSIPVNGNEIRSFEYKDGAFFYIRNYTLLKYQNGSIEELQSNSIYAMTPVSNLSYIYSYFGSGNTFGVQGYGLGYLLSFNISGQTNDLYFDDSSNLWVYGDYNGAKISKYDGSSVELIYNSGDIFPTSQCNGCSNLKTFGSKVYFNMNKSLFSMSEDGNNVVLITSSNDEKEINGIVITD